MYLTIKAANNNVTDQTAQMCSLISGSVVCQLFSHILAQNGGGCPLMLLRLSNMTFGVQGPGSFLNCHGKLSALHAGLA